MKSQEHRCRENSEMLPDAPYCVSSYGGRWPEAPTANPLLKEKVFR